jgi:hypothetical protein
MMSVPREGAERLAQTLREILALSEAKRPNHSKSAQADDPTKLLDSQCVNGIEQTFAARRKHASEDRSEIEDQK